MGTVYFPTQFKHILVKSPESPGPHSPLKPRLLPALQDQQMMVEPNWTRQSKLKTRIKNFPCIICANDKLLKITINSISNFKTKKAHSSFKTTPIKGPSPLVILFAKLGLFKIWIV